MQRVARKVGCDAQNNTFDTLEGLKFQWDDEPNGVLKVDYLKTSAAVVRKRRAVEDVGEFSSVVHLKGKKTGIVNGISPRTKNVCVLIACVGGRRASFSSHSQHGAVLKCSSADQIQ